MDVGQVDDLAEVLGEAADVGPEPAPVLLEDDGLGLGGAHPRPPVFPLPFSLAFDRPAKGRNESLNAIVRGYGGMAVAERPGCARAFETERFARMSFYLVHCIHAIIVSQCRWSPQGPHKGDGPFFDVT